MSDDKKILIVEDEQTLLDAVTFELQEAGYNVSSATNGNEAVEKIKTENPDLVLLDILLPGKNGFEILDAIKKDEEIKAIPVVMLTNLSQEEDKNKGLDLGAQEYIVKSSINPEDISGMVQELFHQ